MKQTLCSAATASLATAALFAAATNLNAQITFVDAIHGASGNTLKTGSSLSDETWVNNANNSTANNTQWVTRSTWGNGGTVYQSIISNSGSFPEITTQITGLADGTYDIWAFFWDNVTTNAEKWMLSAGLTSGALTTYSNDTVSGSITTGVVNASTLIFSNSPTITQTAGAPAITYNMFGVKIGQALVTGGTTINVYVDRNFIGASATQNRVWFDGVGYESVPPDVTPPSLTSSTPNATTVPFFGGKFVAEFNESIVLNSGGTITLADTNDGTGTLTITLPDPQVTVSGSKVTIKPTAQLEVGANYDILISNNAIKDLASSPNFFAATTSGDWTFTPVPLAINNFVDGSDAATGVSTTTSYTHLVDIQKDSDTAVINGVTFDNTLASYTLTGTTGNFVNTNISANAGTGIRDLLGNFSFGGTISAPPTLTLTGLTPGQTYKLRLYVGHWVGQTVNFSFDNTVPATTVDGIDRGAGQNIPSSLDYTYTLAPGDTDLAVTITPGTDSFHWYGFSNELVGIPVNTFSNWISNPTYGIAAVDRDLLDDPDGDNLPNGVEAWFGTHPGEFSTGLSGPSTNGTVTTFTHLRNDSPPSDLAISYQWSPDLTNWYAGDGVAGPLGGATVNIQALTAAGTTTVTATASTPLQRVFLRAEVKQN